MTPKTLSQSPSDLAIILGRYIKRSAVLSGDGVLNVAAYSHKKVEEVEVCIVATQ